MLAVGWLIKVLCSIDRYVNLDSLRTFHALILFFWNALGLQVITKESLLAAQVKDKIEITKQMDCYNMYYPDKFHF